MLSSHLPFEISFMLSTLHRPQQGRMFRQKTLEEQTFTVPPVVSLTIMQWMMPMLFIWLGEPHMSY